MLVLTTKAARIIRYAAEAYPHRELSGWGRIEVMEDAFHVTNIIIPKQTVTGASADVSADTLDEMVQALAIRGETLADWRLWWHSHGALGAFASSTDRETLRQLALEVNGDYERGKSHVPGWFLGLTVNSRGETYGWGVVCAPTLLQFDDLPVSEEGSDDDALRAEVKALVDANVTVKSFLPAKRFVWPDNYGGDDSFLGAAPTKRGRKRRQKIADMDDEEFAETYARLEGYGFADVYHDEKGGLI